MTSQPGWHAPLIGPDGRLSKPLIDYLQGLTNSTTDLSALDARLAALEAGESVTYTGINGVTVYGNGTIGLTQVVDSGAGALLGITRDNYGRVTGTTDATITGTTDRIAVANGNASAGVPTVDIAATYVGQASITTLGTITTGTWQGTVVGVAYGGTGLASYTVGDLLYASGATTLAKLAAGTSTHILTSNGPGVAPSWQAAPAGYSDEQAQDAIGAMVGASLVYVDGTPLLARAALTGDVTAAQDSNATTLATTQAAVHTWQAIQTFEAAGVQYEQFTVIDADNDGATALNFASVAGIGGSGRGWRLACSSTNAVQGTLSIERWNGANWAIIGTWASTAPYLTVNGGTVWHSSNDGAGSGLDADTLDGVNPTADALLLLADSDVPRLGTINTWALAQTFTAAPVFTDQSGSRTALGLGTAAVKNTGTSGNTVPLLDGANVWSAVNEGNVGGTGASANASAVWRFVRATAGGTQATIEILSGATSNTTGISLGDTADADRHGWYVDLSTDIQRWRVATATAMTLSATALTLPATPAAGDNSLKAATTAYVDRISPIGKHAVPVMAGSMLPSATGGCAALARIASAANQPDIVTLDFDTTTQEYAQFSIPMPSSWNEGTVTFQAIWSHAATTTNFGVVWDLQAIALSDDDAIAQNFGTAQTSTDTGGTTNDVYVSPESAAITIAGTPAAKDVVFFRLSRVTGNGSDTMAIDARLHGIILYMTTDAPVDT